MEIFKFEELCKLENPTPGERHRQDILTGEQLAQKLAGIFVTLPPGAGTPYHYHRERESIIIAISGEATETVEGKDFRIKANEVLYIPAGEKHGLVNNSDKEFRFLEFFTGSIDAEDRVEAEK